MQKIREIWRNDNQLNWCKIYWWDQWRSHLMTKGGLGPPYAFFRLRWDFPFLAVCTMYIIRVQKIRETWRNDNQLNRCKIYWWEWDLVQYAPIESLVWTFWTLFVCVCVCVCVWNLWNNKVHDWPMGVGSLVRLERFVQKVYIQSHYQPSFLIGNP